MKAQRKIFPVKSYCAEGTPIEYSLYIDGLQSIRLQLFAEGRSIGMIETLEYKQIDSDDKEVSKLISSDGVRVLAANEINMLSDWRKNKPKDFERKYGILMDRLKNASNSQDVINAALIKLEKTADIDDTIVGDMYALLLSLDSVMTDENKQRAVNHAKKHFENKPFLYKKINGYVKHQAGAIILKLDENGDLFLRKISKTSMFEKYFKTTDEDV